MDMSLDDLIHLQKAKGEKSKASATRKANTELNGTRSSSYSKFDRINRAHDSESDDEGISSQNSSFEITQKERPKPIRTETSTKEKTQSQRLNKNRLEDGIRNGRVEKNNMIRVIAPSMKVIHSSANMNINRTSNNASASIGVGKNRQPITYASPSPVIEQSDKIIVRKIIRQPGSNRCIQVELDVTNLVAPFIDPVPIAHPTSMQIPKALPRPSKVSMLSESTLPCRKPSVQHNTPPKPAPGKFYFK
jgi:hypothetical protein